MRISSGPVNKTSDRPLLLINNIKRKLLDFSIWTMQHKSCTKGWN